MSKNIKSPYIFSNNFREMENRSNKTHLCSVIWNFVERNEEGSTATCNECKKNGKETRWLRTHPGQNGLSFPISNIRTHLRRVHKIQLDEVQYDDSTPGNNKRIGYVQNKYNCPFCGMNFDSKNLKLQWRSYFIHLFTH
jgi:ribosomal protein L37AE/L43A